jgi:hypothetical protein
MWGDQANTGTMLMMAWAGVGILVFAGSSPGRSIEGQDMLCYTLRLEGTGADLKPHVENFEAASEELAIALAEESTQNFNGVLDWTVARLLNSSGNVIWSTSRTG